MDKKTAALALLPGLDLTADFFTLSSSTVLELADVAKAVGYRRPRNANGSTARYFFAYLARANLRDYHQNGTAPTRLIKRREKI